MVLRQAGPQGDAFKLRVFSINAVVLLGRPVICEVDLGEHISFESCSLTDFANMHAEITLALIKDVRA